MDVYIVTGASRGLGESLAKQVLKKGAAVVCIARNVNQQLQSFAEEAEGTLYVVRSDLSVPEEADQAMDKAFSFLQLNDAFSVTLINNAGMVEPISPVGKTDTASLSSQVNLNLLAPMILSSAFTRLLENFQGKKRIVNISSGAASNPYQGWSAYCSTKAGLDMFTKTLAAEQRDHSAPVESISFSPGVMDTEMQKIIRETNKNDFAHVDRFREHYIKGELRSTDFVAELLLNLLSGHVENGRIYSVKEMI
ncbi:(S)-benzoin forming benzil reductase [Bacillus lacus]|uniref:(S)-benzoin forming benzil reductase n=1 Tax=Metabacillus lacus TaxID=1983721 RepID=A0A7X2J1Y8_9BACI|nr:(S)-benzoin forming benzil reductase [Metabacillus lacus]MRX73183.1 (S)-benzoin forming benzil reductase [Metabacillus lacus]